MSRVAVLGLGAMGLRMAQRLIEAKHEVVVYNRTAARVGPLLERGAEHAASPARAAQSADVVISMVTDDDASRAVWLDPEVGALRALRRGAVAVESSTVTPGWVRTLHSAVTGAGADLLDAPVVGSRPQAEAGQLVYLVGGEEATLDRARGLLSTMGKTIHHVGGVGDGTLMKLVVNALFGVQVAALSEMLSVAERAGIEVSRAVEILGQIPVTSPALQGIGRLIAAQKYEPMFPIDLVAKDLRYLIETAEKLGATTPAASATRGVYAEAQKAGLGKDNIAGVAQLYLKKPAA